MCEEKCTPEYESKFDTLRWKVIFLPQKIPWIILFYNTKTNTKPNSKMRKLPSANKMGLKKFQIVGTTLGDKLTNFLNILSHYFGAIVDI